MHILSFTVDKCPTQVGLCCHDDHDFYGNFNTPNIDIIYINTKLTLLNEMFCDEQQNLPVQTT